jgi:hypothetical protein
MHHIQMPLNLRRPLKVCPFGGVAAGCLVLGSPAQALTWNWSFVADDTSYGSGTFTTGSTPGPDGVYAITGISGTYSLLIPGSPSNYATWTINGLDPNSTAYLHYSGSSAQPLKTDYDGIYFDFVSGSSSGYSSSRLLYANIYHNSPGFGAAEVFYYNGLGPGGPDRRSLSITSSSLEMVPDPVPSPLPVFGAAAAFNWSRRLRRGVSLRA